MIDTTYHVHLRDNTTAIFLIGEMYQASVLQATTMSNVHVQGLSRFVQRTTLYNADPANIVNDILQPRPDNVRPILAPNSTATILTVYKLHLDEYTSVANDIRTIAQHITSGLSPSATTALHAHTATHPDLLHQPWQLQPVQTFHQNRSQLLHQDKIAHLTAIFTDTVDTLVQNVGKCSRTLLCMTHIISQLQPTLLLRVDLHGRNDDLANDLS